MGAHRTDADVKALGDLFVTQPFGECSQDLPFTRSEFAEV